MRKFSRILTRVIVATAVALSGTSVASAQLPNLNVPLSSTPILNAPLPNLNAPLSSIPSVSDFLPTPAPQPQQDVPRDTGRLHNALVQNNNAHRNYQNAFAIRKAEGWRNQVMRGEVIVLPGETSEVFRDSSGGALVIKVEHRFVDSMIGIVQRTTDGIMNSPYGVASGYDGKYIYAVVFYPFG